VLLSIRISGLSPTSKLRALLAHPSSMAERRWVPDAVASANCVALVSYGCDLAPRFWRSKRTGVTQKAARVETIAADSSPLQSEGVSIKIDVNHDGAVGSKAPWNNGKIIGPKPPLRTKNVWSIRSKLQVEGSLRDLAMFNFAIDSKLRGCDVVSAKVEDIDPHGTALDRATVRQRKTARVHRRVHQGNTEAAGGAAAFPAGRSRSTRVLCLAG
jgi:hypothetical protein